MAYDEYLAERIAGILQTRNVSFEVRKMMGGLCYMVDDKMCVGVTNEKLMARLDPEFYEDALTMKGCRKMDFTGRPMKGFVWVEPAGVDMDNDLEYWIRKALEFNPIAKSSKKKKK